MRTCEVCGEPGAHSIYSTRCQDHLISRPHRVRAVLACPPGRQPED